MTGHDYHIRQIYKIANEDFSGLNDNEIALIQAGQAMTRNKTDRAGTDALMKAPIMDERDYKRLVTKAKSLGGKSLSDVNLIPTTPSLRDPFSTGLMVDLRKSNGEKNYNDTKMVADNLMERHPNFKSVQGIQDNRANIIAPRNKHITLHEMGHVVDNDSDEARADIAKYENSGSKALKGALLTPAASLVGGLINPYVGLGAAALGGAYSGYHKRKDTGLTLRREQGANNFVKKYLKDELGSEEAAERDFSSSPLIPALNTYKQQHKKTPVKMGLTVAGIGAGTAALGSVYRKVLNNLS